MFVSLKDTLNLCLNVLCYKIRGSPILMIYIVLWQNKYFLILWSVMYPLPIGNTLSGDHLLRIYIFSFRYKRFSLASLVPVLV